MQWHLRLSRQSGCGRNLLFSRDGFFSPHPHTDRGDDDSLFAQSGDIAVDCLDKLAKVVNCLLNVFDALTRERTHLYN